MIGATLADVVEIPLHEAPHLAVLLDQLGRRMRLRSEAQLAGVGLRPRHLVALGVLRDRADLTQHALALILQVDRTNLVGLLNELEAEALVERRRSPQDRRRHLVVLTGAGQQRLADAEAALTEAEDDVLSALTPAQRHTLYALLRQTSTSHIDNCTADAPPRAPARPGGLPEPASSPDAPPDTPRSTS